MSSANKNRYTLSSSGYTGNDKRLGGPISINYREVFKVKSDRPYYLKGNVVDFYDGNSWRKSYENYHEKQDSSDMQYINYGVRITDIKNSMTIYPYEKFKTNTIFVPNYTFNVTDSNNCYVLLRNTQRCLAKPRQDAEFECTTIENCCVPIRNAQR